MNTILVVVGVIVVVALFSEKGRETLGKTAGGIGGWISKMFADGKGVVPVIMAVALLLVVSGITAASKNPVFAEWFFGGIGPGHAKVQAREFDEANRELILNPGMNPLKDYADTEAPDGLSGPDGMNNPILRSQANVLFTSIQIEAKKNEAEINKAQSVINKTAAEAECALAPELRHEPWRDSDPATSDIDPCEWLKEYEGQRAETFELRAGGVGNSLGQATRNFITEISEGLNEITLFRIGDQSITLLGFVVVLGTIGLIFIAIVRAKNK